MSDIIETPAGQEPAGVPASQAGATQHAAGQAPSQDQNNPEIERLKAELEKTRKEAASHRVKLKEFTDAQLSESDKQKARLAELEAENLAKDVRARAKALEAAVTKAAFKANLNPELAMKLVEPGKATFGEDGEVLNAETLVNAALKAFPELTNRGGSAAGNGGRGQTLAQSAEQREAELRGYLSGTNSNPFDPAWQQAHGGGVIWNKNAPNEPVIQSNDR
jgi:hypothetical protein